MSESYQMRADSFPCDMSEQEWLLLARRLPPAKPGGRPRSVDLCGILNGSLYWVRTGCAWRYLPRDAGCWSPVHHEFRRWRRDGTWEHIPARLGEPVRLAAGREATPRGALLDSPSVKTTERGGPRGFDGAKKMNGRTRHVRVDPRGLVLTAVVYRREPA
jgi:putative transposase